MEVLSRVKDKIGPGAGGCDFLINPELRANETNVFWLPELNANAVLLAAAPGDFAALKFSPSQRDDVVARRSAEDGEYLIIGGEGETHQLWLPNPLPEGSSIAAIIPFDEMIAQRTEAVMRFWRYMAGVPPRAGPSNQASSTRLVRALRALDGRLSGAPYRAIAEILFGVSRVTAEPWKTASVRDTTIRLVRKGISFMQGGYRDLLRRRKLD